MPQNRTAPLIKRAWFSGYCVVTAVFALITFQGRQKMTEENHEWKKNTIDIHHKKSIQVLNQHGINCKFWLCHSKYVLEIDDKLIMVLVTTFRNRKSLGEKKNTQTKQKLNPMQTEVVP